MDARKIMAGGLPSTVALAIAGDVGTLAATGSAQTDAAAITADVTRVTGADGTKGVILPAVGSGYYVIGNAVASILKVYPPSGGAINGGSANAAFSQTASKNAVYYYASATDIVAVLSA